MSRRLQLQAVALQSQLIKTISLVGVLILQGVPVPGKAVADLPVVHREGDLPVHPVLLHQLCVEGHHVPELLLLPLPVLAHQLQPHSHPVQLPRPLPSHHLAEQLLPFLQALLQLEGHLSLSPSPLQSQHSPLCFCHPELHIEGPLFHIFLLEPTLEFAKGMTEDHPQLPGVAPSIILDLQFHETSERGSLVKVMLFTECSYFGEVVPNACVKGGFLIAIFPNEVAKGKDLPLVLVIGVVEFLVGKLGVKFVDVLRHLQFFPQGKQLKNSQEVGKLLVVRGVVEAAGRLAGDHFDLLARLRLLFPPSPQPLAALAHYKLDISDYNSQYQYHLQIFYITIPDMHIQLLKAIGQPQLIEAYEQAPPPQQQLLDQQLSKMEKTYPGGLRVYHKNALELLKASADGVNPYANYIVGKPQGLVVSYEDLDTWQKYERLGLQQLKQTCFMLVAGGLGQRLGYPGIKVSIPKELLTEKCFIKYYCQYIRAYQLKYCEGGAIPFAIMTSQDTHQKTVQLLQKNGYFGLKESQVTILTQEKVPALIDNDAHFKLLPDQLLLETKPHGHGDVHTLLHMSGLAQKWKKEGKKWITVFQDTNPFALRSFPLLLGISAQNDFDFNTLGVPRKPGEAVGAITTLVHKETKKTLTINIEYNQVESAFKEIGGEPVLPNGYSQFPGNTNCFALKLDTYVQVLDKTQGLISQFINPKYADATKTKFKSSARLECMMQDYPKLLPNCDKVGFASVPKGYCFSALKNDLASATLKHQQGLSGEGAPHCEADIYINNRHLLRLAGAEIQEGKPIVAGGSELAMFPMVSISPFFATCLTELKQKVKKLKVHPNSALIVESDCVLEDVEVDGHLQIKEGGKVVVKHIEKDYVSLEQLDKEVEEPHLTIRGYTIKKQKK